MQVLSPDTSGRLQYLLLIITDGKDDAVYRLPLQEIRRLDERAYIVDEFVGHVGTVLGYPLTRNELFVICNLVNIFYFCAALVRIVGQTLENNHFAGIPFICSLDGSTAYLISFQDITRDAQWEAER